MIDWTNNEIIALLQMMFSEEWQDSLTTNILMGETDEQHAERMDAEIAALEAEAELEFMFCVIYSVVNGKGSRR